MMKFQIRALHIFYIVATVSSSVSALANQTNTFEQAGYNSAVGASDGSLTVDRFGAANYRMPISVPRGAGGFQPQLALVYSSQSKQGIAGIGWRIEGLSAIHRCAAIPLLHGKRGRITFTDEDSLCLDGIFLEEIADNEYRTQIESFTKVTRNTHYSTNLRHVFEARTKSGYLIHYGAEGAWSGKQSDDLKVVSWFVDMMQDLSGNQIHLRYSGPTKERRVAQIDYTTNTIQFEYEPRSYPTFRYLSGVQQTLTKRLKRIASYADGQLLREYKLDYHPPAGLSSDQVASITECVAENDCLRPTYFVWNQTSTPQFDNHLSFLQQSKSSPERYRVGDFNGDGFSDIYYIGAHTSDADSIYFGNDDDMVQQLSGSNIDLVKKDDIGNLVIADFNGDGLSDIYHFRYRHPQDLIYVAVFEEGELSFDTMAGIYSGTASNPKVNNACVHIACLKFGDFNGDGKVDIYHVKRPQDIVYLADGSGGYTTMMGATSLSEQRTLSKTQLSRLHTGDFNGDFVTDLYQINRNGKDKIFLTLGDSQYEHMDGIDSVLGRSRDQSVETMRIQFGDFNGDGLSDIYYVAPQSNIQGDTNVVYISRGDGSYKQIAAPSLAQRYPDLRSAMQRIRLVDVNGDGITDIYYMNNAGGDDVIWSLANMQWQQFAGNPATVTGNTSEAVARLGFADFNGDGTLDIYQLTKTVRGDATIYTGRSGTPLMTEIVDGLGLRTEIDYRPLPTVHTPNSDEYATPENTFSNLVLPLWVVVANTIDGEPQENFNYIGSQFHAAGLGFVGFNEIHRQDMQHGITQQEQYLLDYPYLGMVSAQTMVATGDGYDELILSEQLMTYENLLLHEGKTQFPHLQHSVTKRYELDGQQTVEITTRYEDYDDYGNARRMITATDDGTQRFVQYTENEFITRESQWLLNLLQRQTITNSDGVRPDIRHTTVFEYGKSHLPIRKINQPDHPLSLIDEYRYDSFGNQISVATRAATGNVSRLTQMQYDNQGIFPTEQINALGHRQEMVYDPRFAKPILLTDENQRQQQNDYDDWGRVIGEIRRNGIVTTTTYTYDLPELATADSTYLVREQTSGKPLLDRYYNQRREMIREVQRGFDQRYIIRDYRYDTLGRLVAVSLPYFAGTKDEQQIWTYREYDIRDRMIAERTPFPGRNISFSISYAGREERRRNTFGQEQTLIRDGYGKVIQIVDSDNGQVDLSYDVLGRLLRIYDAGGAETTMEYDIFGNRTLLNDPHRGVHSFTYDAFGQLLTENSENLARSFRYDKAGRLVQRNDDGALATWWYDVAENGVGKLAGESFANHQRRFSYDRTGRVAQIKDHRGFTTTSHYNKSGQLIKVDYPSGFSVQRSYSEQGYLSALQMVVPQWQSSGPSSAVSKKVTAPNKVTEYQMRANFYRKLAANNQPMKQRLTNAAKEFDDGVEHLRAPEDYTDDTEVQWDTCKAPLEDKLGRAQDLINDAQTMRGVKGADLQLMLGQQFVDESGIYLRCIENEIDTLPATAEGDDKFELWRALQRDSFGNVVVEQAGNGWRTHWGFNTARHLVSIRSENAGGDETRNLLYYYDELGNITDRHDNRQRIDEYFDYDNLNRLISATVIGPNDDIHNQAFFYTYDENGNLSYQSGVGNYEYNNVGVSHQLAKIDSHEYLHDSAGNLTQAPNFAAQWGPENNPVTTETKDVTSDYYYDANYALVTKHSTNDDSTYYVGDLYTESHRGESVNQCGKIYAERRIIATYCNKDGVKEINYLHHDALGSIDTVSDKDGKAVARFEYSPFGERRYSVGEAPLNLGYTGHEHLNDLSLIHMKGRLYDPRRGQFLSPDPHIAAPLATQSYNRYSYAMNNPLRYSDPSGFFFKKILKKIGSLFRQAVKYAKQNYRLVAATAAGYYIGGLVSSSVVKSASSQLIWSPGAMASGAYMSAYGQVLATGSFVGGVTGAAVANTLSGGNLRSVLANGIGGGASCLVGACYAGGALTAKRLVLSAGINGATAAAAGGNFKNAALAGLAGGTLRYAAMQMRNQQIAESKLNPDNASGLSEGFRGDKFRLGGSRFNNGQTQMTALGGIQGGQGNLFGSVYAPGSWRDYLVEAFAGPHDFLNSWYWYDRVGNVKPWLTPMQRWAGEGLNAANVVLAAPFAAAAIAPDYFYSLAH